MFEPVTGTDKAPAVAPVKDTVPDTEDVVDAEYVNVIEQVPLGANDTGLPDAPQLLEFVVTLDNAGIVAYTFDAVIVPVLVNTIVLLVGASYVTPKSKLAADPDIIEDPD